MQMKKLFVASVIILAGFPWSGAPNTISTQANPIPWPWSTEVGMLFENIYVQIEPDSNGLHAVFTGDFTFTHLPSDVNSILFPLPSDATNISVWQDNNEIAWELTNEQYPTILPEMPKIPIIKWYGPFPTDGPVFRVEYEHSLIKRPEEFIFFYATGTGKYLPNYGDITIARIARFEIVLPEDYTVKGVWLDEKPQQYGVIDSNLIEIYVDSLSGPIMDDLIISLVPRYFEGCGVLVQGVECVLFQADTGGLYALDNIGDFQVGDRVWVQGVLNPYCATICMQGNTCIENNIISACPEEGAGKPGLSKYYIPYDSPIEPNAPG